MNFVEHSELRNKHAFLSPSGYHWVNYDVEKLRALYDKQRAVERGVAHHFLARQLIELGIKLPRNKKALNQFVNDAIGYRMTPEQPLFYSRNAFGTTDAICFRNNFLRVHDLKTGTTRVVMQQLEIYAALFCLEYDKKPTSIDIELRIYQGTNIIVHIPESPEIRRIMEKIIMFDKKIEEFKNEEENPWL